MRRVFRALRLGIVGEPPPEQVIGTVDRVTEQREPGCAELRLKAKRRRGPLGGRPNAPQNDDDDGQHLAPKDLRSGHCDAMRCKPPVAQAPSGRLRTLADSHLQWRVCWGEQAFA